MQKILALFLSALVAGVHVYAYTLRALPLGDSITFGLQSSDGNGYRQKLQTLITSSGNTVDFIGSVMSGNMTDNQNEGHSGAIISQISSFADASLPQRPNIVYLLAGTNDVSQNIDLANAPSRLSSLIDKIFRASPNAVVLVGSLPPNQIAGKQAPTNTYNTQIQQLVQTRANSGQHIVFVSNAAITTADMADVVHPNDNGYQKMANAWFNRTQTANQKGWIRNPA